MISVTVDILGIKDAAVIHISVDVPAEYADDSELLQAFSHGVAGGIAEALVALNVEADPDLNFEAITDQEDS